MTSPGLGGREVPSRSGRRTDVFEGVRNVSGGEVAGLVVAVFWAVLVAFLAVVLVRLAEALREATRLVAGVREQTVPLLGEAAGAVRAAGARLERADTVTPAVTSVVKADAATAATAAATGAREVREVREVREARVVAAGASALSSTVSSAFDGPLAKVAALGYGLRYAVHQQGDGAQAARRAPGRGRSSARTARAIRAARAVRARTAIAAPRAELGRGGGRSTRRSKG